ncbi:hypothetical protein KHA80_11105 [Anaerobacillus sp. HL2]|nr:hypothetical protein KHA80_11105 [Anaerobacillus sp. HL2]
MDTIIYINWGLFFCVTGFSVSLFASLVRTHEFIKLGKKAEWNKTLKERI